MALSRLAEEFAAEIRLQDWSDAPYRADRAGHRRENDSPSKLGEQLTPEETETVLLNVMWVAGQVLAYRDPNFGIYEFAEACGVNTRNGRGGKDGWIEAGLRKSGGKFHRPGHLEW